MVHIPTKALSAAHALTNSFAQWRGNAHDVRVACAPGRVNLIGEHTDYNEGFVLPMTLGHAVYVAARPVEEKQHHIRSLHYNEDVTFPVGTLPEVPQGHWATYVSGMLRELQVLHQKEIGFEMLISGDVPSGAGLSSSAALEMAVAIAVEDIAHMTVPPADIAKMGQHVEHVYVGVQCGIMDQMASRLGKNGHALFIDCRSTKWKLIPLPLDRISIVIIDSGVRRKLASSKYNERRAQCAEAVDWFQRIDPHIVALRDVPPDLMEKQRHRLPHIPGMRAQHVVTENARVKDAIRLLRQSDFAGFGARMFHSHTSLRDLYEVSCPELDFLVTTASKLPGTLGARMTGGGFGGCTVNLIQKSDAPVFCEQILSHYARTYEHAAQTIIVDENIEAGIILRTS